MQDDSDMPTHVTNSQKLVQELANSATSASSAYPNLFQINPGRNRRLASDPTAADRFASDGAIQHAASEALGRSVTRAQSDHPVLDRINGSTQMRSIIPHDHAGKNAVDENNESPLLQPQEVSSLQRMPMHKHQGNSVPSPRPISTYAVEYADHADFDCSDPDMWTSQRVIDWLEMNAFGKDWQETFLRQKIEKAEFLALTSYVKVRRVVPLHAYGPEAGARLCNAIRKMLERQDQSYKQQHRRPSHPLESIIDSSSKTGLDIEATASATAHLSRLSLEGKPYPARNATKHQKSQSLDALQRISIVSSGDSSGNPSGQTNGRELQSIDSASKYAYSDTLSKSPARLALRSPGKPLPSSSQQSRRFILATVDNETYKAVDITAVKDCVTLKNVLAQRFLLLSCDIFASEIGGTWHERPLSDGELSKTIFESENAEINIVFIGSKSGNLTAYDNTSMATIVSRSNLNVEEPLDFRPMQEADTRYVSPTQQQCHNPMERSESKSSLHPSASSSNSGNFLPDTRKSRADLYSTSHTKRGPAGGAGQMQRAQAHSGTTQATRRATTDDSFCVFRPRKEIDFDAPRPSPYYNQEMSLDASPVRRTESWRLQRRDSQLIAHRPAPQRPPPKPPIQSARHLTQSTSLSQDSQVAGPTQSRRGPASSHLRLAKSREKFSFADAPSLDTGDLSDTEDETAFWAIRPQPLAANAASINDTSTKEDSPRLTHQSMKLKNHSRSPITPAGSLTEFQAQKYWRTTSPEYTTGDDTVVLDSPAPDRASSKDLKSPSWPLQHGQEQTSPVPNHTIMAGGRNIKAMGSLRPSTELLYENLQSFFPNHDLDKPIIEDKGENFDFNKGIAADDTNPNRLQEKRPRMKSIRIVAKEANEARKRYQSVADKVRGAALLRRRSTKVWGQKAIEVTPSQLSKDQKIVAEDDEVMKRSPTFKWLKGELIGKGQFGHVYLAMNVTSGEMLAVKQVKIPRGTLGRSQSNPIMENLNLEIETMRDLDHVNIVQYLGYERTQDDISIFLEYVPGGSVGSCLRRCGKFDESLIRSLTIQTLQGLQYLHLRGIMHRDLKADNLLLDLDGTCKISDFGISKKSRDVYTNDGSLSMQGTIFWMAPEVIQTKKQGYSAKIDIWSLGCLVLEMFAGRRPWSNEEAISVLYTLGTGQPPPIPTDVEARLSPAAHDFLQQCFVIDPAKRPTATQLLGHEFCVLRKDYIFQMPTEASTS